MDERGAKPADFARDWAAAMAWWDLAGADVPVRDATAGWLDAETGAQDRAAGETASPAPVPPPKNIAEGPRIRASALTDLTTIRAQWPGDLAAFHKWWMAAEALDVGGAYPRVAPAGTAGPALMVLTLQPGADDRALLSDGAEAQLVASVLRALGHAIGDTYRAAILPRHTLHPDWQEIVAAGYGALARHHVGLAKPEAVLALGARIPSLLAHDAAQDPANLRKINLEEGSVPLFAAPDPASLLARGTLRARMWDELLEWTDGVL